MRQPIIEKALTDNDEHSHWNLLDFHTGELLWSECPEEEMAKNGRASKGDELINGIKDIIGKYKTNETVARKIKIFLKASSQ